MSEALARLHLDEEVRVEYVKEAHRLLQKSIIFVESEDIELEDNEEGWNNYVQSFIYSYTYILTQRNGKSHGIYHRDGK